MNTTLYLTCIVSNRIIPRRASQRRNERGSYTRLEWGTLAERRVCG